MKSVLRRIHRDLKREFRTFTSFNLNRLYREKRYFISCLDEYSKVIFGVSPTQREIVLLGKETYLYTKLNSLLKYKYCYFKFFIVRKSNESYIIMYQFLGINNIEKIFTISLFLFYINYEVFRFKYHPSFENSYP